MEPGNQIGTVRPGIHRFSMSSRQATSLSGIEDVQSFDEHEVVLQTVDGILTIHGTGLHIKRLSLERGEVDMEGKVDSFEYSEKTGFRKNGESFFTRLFR